MSQLGLADAPPTQTNALYKNQKLGNCPDCGKEISRTALSCPNCGRGFSSRHFTNVSRGGWVGTIAGGVILGYIGILFINIIVFFVIFIFFGALIAGSVPHK